MITTNIHQLSTQHVAGVRIDTNVETDPIFRHSPAYTITEQDIQNWDAGAGVDLSAYVTKSELVEQSYITINDVVFPDYSNTYQAKGEYVTPSDLTAQSYVTQNTVVFPDYNNTYQSKGDYITPSDLENAAYLTSETDPVFSASPAAGITAQDIQNWNEGAAADLSSYVTKSELSAQSYLTSVDFPDYSNTYQAKGNYLTQEQDPIFTNSPAGSITSTDIANWNAAAGTIDMGAYVTKNELVTQSYITINDVVFPDYSNTYQAKGNYLTSESDPIFNASPAARITNQDITNWNTGASVDLSSYVTKSELSAQSYLTTESDPIFSASPAAGITAQDIQNWNTGSGVDLNAYVKKYGSESQIVTVSDYLDVNEHKNITLRLSPSNDYSYESTVDLKMLKFANTDEVDTFIDLTSKNSEKQSIIQLSKDSISLSTTGQIRISGQTFLGDNVRILYDGHNDFIAAYGFVEDEIKKYVINQSYLTSVTFPDYSSTYQAKGDYVTPSQLATQGYITSVTFPDYSSTYQAKGNYLTSETDPVFSASPAAGITAQDITNWNAGAGIDLSSYVSYNYLSAQSYVTNTQIQNYGYTTVRLVTEAQYQDRQDNILYVITDADPIDITDCVTKTQLVAQSYVKGVYDSGAYYIDFDDNTFIQSTGDEANGNFTNGVTIYANNTDNTYNAAVQQTLTYTNGEYNAKVIISARGNVGTSNIKLQNGGVELVANTVYLGTSTTRPTLSTNASTGALTVNGNTVTFGTPVKFNSTAKVQYNGAADNISSYGYVLDKMNEFVVGQSYVTTSMLNAQAYLTSETDPVFSASAAATITQQDITNWNNGGGVDLSNYVTYQFLSSQAYLTSVTFPDYSSTYQAAGNYITPSVLVSQSYITPATLVAQSYITTATLVAQSYLTTETDPVFSASAAAGITAQDIINWNNGGGVDLSDYVTYEFLTSQAYLTSVTFPDYSSTYQAAGDYVTKTELVAQSYITNVTFPDYSNTYQAKGNYITSETDPVFSASPAGSITSTDIANWNAAAGGIDLSSYVTKSELSSQSYVTNATVTHPDYFSTYTSYAYINERIGDIETLLAAL